MTGFHLIFVRGAEKVKGRERGRNKERKREKKREKERKDNEILLSKTKDVICGNNSIYYDMK